MLVSHGKKFIYTKTVKTAGTSVESYFEKYCMTEGDWSREHTRNEYVSEAGIVGQRSNRGVERQSVLWWNHMPAKAIKGMIGDDIWNEYFKFCVVRNPFTKMVSSYKFHNKWSFNRKNLALGKNVRDLKDKLDGSFHKKRFEEFLQWIPLPLDRNKYQIDGEFCMDHVIRFENLNEGVKEVCEQLGIEYDPSHLPHYKPGSSGMSVSDYYSEKSIDMVSKAYAWELEKFEYERPW